MRITPRDSHTRHLHRTRPPTTLHLRFPADLTLSKPRAQDEAGRLTQLPHTPPSQFQIPPPVDVAFNTPPSTLRGTSDSASPRPRTARHQEVVARGMPAASVPARGCYVLTMTNMCASVRLLGGAALYGWHCLDVSGVPELGWG